MSAARFDPVTLEVIRNRLDVIAEEMQATLLKSSCSPIVKEGLDASASLFTTDGTTLAQACAIPIHLATLIPAVRSILDAFPLAGMAEGDVYLLNDPYLGGTHLPDIAVVMPVFAGGRPIALAATMTHHQDVGGLAAGSVPPNATEIFQEGLRLPPVRWAHAGVFDATLTGILRLNVRIPEIFMGDLHAQIAACKIAGERMRAAAERFGRETLEQAFGLLIDKAAVMTRAALRAIPDGTYRHVDWLDNDGVELDRRLRIEVAVTVAGEEIHFDLTGTSGQSRGPVNCVPSGSLAAACFAVRALTDPAIPNNGGCFRPIRLTLPEGSLVNPRPPAAVNARSATIKRITGCMLAALAGVLPGRVPAPSAGQLLVIAFGGLRAGGEAFVTGELLAGGSGAGDGFDGVDAIETDATNCMNLPAEAMELDAPIRVRSWSLHRDSGGPGRWRGGLGQVKEFEILAGAEGPVSFSHRGERHFVAAGGMAGGGAGGFARSWIDRADGRREEIPSKCVASLAAGDRVRVATAGGGGWGPPTERPRAAVEGDLADGKIGPEGSVAYRIGPAGGAG
jgi:N-methylhydantoinase B